jgi:uncharacterized surface protein with fasciclin (FAS1) repeats
MVTTLNSRQGDTAVLKTFTCLLLIACLFPFAFGLNARAQDTAEATAAPEAEAVAWLRVFHLVPDYLRLDFYLNDQLLFPDMGFQEFTAHTNVPAGEVVIAATTAGDTLDNAVLTTNPITLEPDHQVIFAIGGQIANDSAGPFLLDETAILETALAVPENAALAGQPDDIARLIIFHALGDVAQIDVYAGGEMAAPGIGYGEYYGFPVTPGEVALTLTAAGNPETVYSAALTPFTMNPGLLYVVALTGTAADPVVVTAQTGLKTIAELLADEPSYSTLLALATGAEAERLLTSVGPITILAPDNNAFEAFFAAADTSFVEVAAQPDQISRIFGAHVIEGYGPYERLIALDSLTTLGGDTWPLVVQADSTIRVGESATIVQPNILAVNGVIHAIDSVLIPEDGD